MPSLAMKRAISRSSKNYARSLCSLRRWQRRNLFVIASPKGEAISLTLLDASRLRCSLPFAPRNDDKSLYDKIPSHCPRSSVDRVSASGAEERSSSLRGGAIAQSPPQGGFCFYFSTVQNPCGTQMNAEKRRFFLSAKSAFISVQIDFVR